MSKNRLFDEIISGVWLWSFFLGLASVGLPIANDRKHFMIPKESLLFYAAAIAGVLLVLIGLSQLASPKKLTSDSMPPHSNSDRWKALLSVVGVDAVYAAIVYDVHVQNPIPWGLLGAVGLIFLVLLWVVFKKFFG